MALITDPTAVAFINKNLRTYVDKFASLQEFQTWMQLRWDTVIVPAITGAADADEFDDGSHSDGRVSVTKLDAVNFFTYQNLMRDAMLGKAVEYQEVNFAFISGLMNNIAVNPFQWPKNVS